MMLFMTDSFHMMPYASESMDNSMASLQRRETHHVASLYNNMLQLTLSIDTTHQSRLKADH